LSTSSNTFTFLWHLYLTLELRYKEPQLHISSEGNVVMTTKASTYLKTMSKELPFSDNDFDNYLKEKKEGNTDRFI
jgi:hypothetical protein